MHSKPPTGPNDSTSAVPEDRASRVRPKSTREKREERAERDLAEHFASVHAGRGGIAEVAAILAGISPYLRGVLTLYHDARAWPAAVTKEFEPYTSLVIRLYLTDHPAQGSTASLERAAAERLAEIVTAGRRDEDVTLFGLWGRASRHYRRALHAYAKAAR